MNKTMIILLACLLPFISCKDNEIPEPDYSELVRNTEWFGLYQNTGEAIVRSYALVFNVDSTFSFYGVNFTHEGFWSVKGKTIRFRFSEGSKNQWKAQLATDSIDQFSLPTPANFSFLGPSKKIGTPPSDVIGHTWTENKESSNPYKITLSQADMRFSKTGGTVITIKCSSAPYKNKIFRFNADAQMVVVDGKTAWSTLSTLEWGEFTY